MASLSLVARGVTILAAETGRTALDRILPDGCSALPLRGADVTPRWLERALGLPAGGVRSVEVADEESGTANRVRLRLDAVPDAPDHVFLKVAPRSFFQRVLMNVTDLALREVLFYRAVAADVPVRVPRCHHAELDARRGRNVVVLEDLTGTATFRDVRDAVTPAEAESVADALADLHAAYWNSPRFDADLAPLRQRSAAAMVLGRAFVRRLLAEPRHVAAELVPPEVVARSRVLYENLIDVERLWASGPQTLLHGDTHLGNLFFEGATPGFLDWQAVMVGPGIRDLAYFTIASTDPTTAREIERGLVERYVARLNSAGIDVDLEQEWTRYRAVIAEFYVAAVVTAGSGDRMQLQDIARSGVGRVVAAVQAHDTFGALEELLQGADPGDLSG